MKKISLLGILAILVIVAEFAYSFTAGWNDFEEGFNEGYNGVHVYSGTHQPEYAGSLESIEVNVRPLAETQVDSLTNSFINKPLPYRVDRVRTFFAPTIWSSIITFFSFLVVIPFLAGTYCLIRMLISVSRRQIFTVDNVIRLRVFTYSLAAFYGLMTLKAWLNHLEAVKQITLPGYEVVTLPHTDWTSLAIIILLTEIFAAGVKIKEEQDLTI